MKKVVVDTNVIAAAIWTQKKNTLNTIIFDKVIKNEILNYACNQIYGEVVNIFNNDPKLKTTNKQYFYAKFDSFIQSSLLIKQPKLEKKREECGKLLEGITSEDRDIVLTCLVSGANYLITWDEKLLNAISGNPGFNNLKALKPQDFVKLP